MRSALAGLVLLFLPVAAVAEGAPAPGETRDAPLVGSLQFPGRMNVREELLRGAVELREGRPITPAALESSRKALLDLGFFRSVTASHQTVDGKAEVSFRVVEWPPVRHIRVLGNNVVDQRAIRAAISTQVGQVLSSKQLVDDIRAIEKVYRDRGYVAHVDQRILDEATLSGILRFELLEVRIADVTVVGAKRRLREKARRALVEVPPALYRPDAVVLDQYRLLRLKGVRHANATVEAITPGTVRIRWILNPPPTPAPQ
jgi:hypothetical protein